MRLLREIISQKKAVSLNDIRAIDDLEKEINTHKIKGEDFRLAREKLAILIKTLPLDNEKIEEYLNELWWFIS